MTKHLGTLIRRILSEREMSYRELRKLSAGTIDITQLNRIITGKQKAMDAKLLSTLARTLARDKKEQAEIIAAHLRDECNGPGADLIQIQIKNGSKMSSNLSPKTRTLAIARK